MSRDLHESRLRSRALAIAHRVLDGEIDILEAAPLLASLLLQLGYDWDDTDDHTFALIDSETDHLPAGKQRSHWAKHAFEEKEPALRSASVWAEEFGLDACRNVVHRFGTVGE